MKQKLGGINPLYPTPTVLVGAIVNEKIMNSRKNAWNNHSNMVSALQLAKKRIS
jgi:hypothetical protein